MSSVAHTLDLCSWAEFAESPWRRFVAGKSWLFYGLEPHVFGYSIFGKPDPDDIAEFVRFLDAEGGAGRAPHAVLIDLGRITGIDAKSFDLIVRYIERCRTSLTEWVTQAVLVGPSAIEAMQGAFDAALVSGFFGVVSAPFPVQFASNMEDALGALELPRTWAVVIHAAVQTIANTDGLRIALRGYFSEHLRAPDIDDAARSLGVSTRTLQRRLAPDGFFSELARARIERARELLLGALPLTAVALEVGFSSAQAFSTAFKRAQGESPSAYRTIHRKK
jgi:AraC-like DNA-binding protein